MKAIQVEHLRFSTRAHFWKPVHTILHDISFEVEAGEVFGFLGPNGAGKTTSIKALLGLLKPNFGKLKIFNGDPNSMRIKRRIGFLPERSYFPEYLSSYELVLQHGLLCGLPLGSARRRSAELLERVGLAEAMQRPLRSYSKGMLQRAGVAQALVGDPDLIIFDEPMSGLDPIGRRDIRDIMRELAQRGKTVFFSTHILPDVEMLCDRVAILMGGRVQQVSRLSELLDQDVGGAEVLTLAQALSPTIFSDIKTLMIGQTRQSDQVLLRTQDLAAANLLVDRLRQHGLPILALHTHRPSLEDIFVSTATEKL